MRYHNKSLTLQSYRTFQKVGLRWVDLEAPVIPSEVRLEPYRVPQQPGALIGTRCELVPLGGRTDTKGGLSQNMSLESQDGVVFSPQVGGCSGHP